MIKNFFINFFRNDLNLKGRWWHRLFLVIFLGLFLLTLYTLYDELFSLNHPYIPRWKVVGSVEERITADVRRIGDLRKIGEKVEERGRSYGLNTPSSEYHLSILKDVYCSNELANNVTQVKSKSGIDTLYLRSTYGRNNVPIETFSNYIRENNIKCLLADAYSYSGRRVQFLEPDKSFQNNFVFYEKSNILTVLYILKMIFFAVAFLVGIVVAYYKIFLFVIFGSEKNNR